MLLLLLNSRRVHRSPLTSWQTERRSSLYNLSRKKSEHLLDMLLLKNHLILPPVTEELYFYIQSEGKPTAVFELETDHRSATKPQRNFPSFFMSLERSRPTQLFFSVENDIKPDGWWKLDENLMKTWWNFSFLKK